MQYLHTGKADSESLSFSAICGVGRKSNICCENIMQFPKRKAATRHEIAASKPLILKNLRRACSANWMAATVLDNEAKVKHLVGGRQRFSMHTQQRLTCQVHE